MNVGVLLIILAVNPPTAAPMLSAPSNVRIAQLDVPSVSPEAVPTPQATIPVSAMPHGAPMGPTAMSAPAGQPIMDFGAPVYGSPIHGGPMAMDFGMGGGCCGEIASFGEFGGGFAAGPAPATGCCGWYDDGSGTCGTTCCHGRLHGLLGGCRHCDSATHIRCRAAWNLSPGDMYPWRPYYPVCHGNYYFRPYHFSDVWKQQQIAARWGANPASPYTSGDLFEQVYLEMGIPGAEYFERVPSPESTKVRPSDHFRPIKNY